MKSLKILIVCSLLVTGIYDTAAAVPQFRKAIFLHHSTGGCIWGGTKVPDAITAYNTDNGLSGDEVSMDETGWPTVWNNEWERWHKLFEKRDTDGEDVFQFFDNYGIIIIKSCFPSSSINGYGTPSDTISHPTNKTIFNYKWHWRSFIKVMKQYPDHFFVIWTNAPLVASATNDVQARLSHEFCAWAKDTLAKGSDPEFGAFPKNVYVFDFFHKLVDGTGKLQPAYASSSGDSHPNGAAADLVAPQFVHETFDTALAYEESVLPVELSSFKAQLSNNQVQLTWTTETEINNYGFEIERATLGTTPGQDSWKNIGFVPSLSGNSNSPKEYSYVDENPPVGNLQYRLKQIDSNGTYKYYSITAEVNFNYTGVTEEQNPKEFNLLQNYPNPFNPGTAISYQLPAAGHVALKVYDLLGNEVAVLVNEFQQSGFYTARFDAGNLAAGVYIYKLNAGKFTAARKLIVMK